MTRWVKLLSKQTKPNNVLIVETCILLYIVVQYMEIMSSLFINIVKMANVENYTVVLPKVRSEQRYFEIVVFMYDDKLNV